MASPPKKHPPAVPKPGMGLPASPSVRISAVIPSHNYIRYLPECIASLQAQSLPPAEIIVVDNGSSDGTAARVRKLAKQSAVPIRLLRFKQPIGRPRARNAGFSAAKSSLIFMLDADDWAEQDALERLALALKNSQSAAFAYGFARLEGQREGLLGYPDYALDELLVHNFIPSCALVRKEAWAAAGGFDAAFGGGAEDYDFWLSLAGRGRFGVRVPSVVFHYRFHGANASDADRPRLLANGYALRKKHAELYSRHALGALGFEVAQAIRRIRK